ncbi:Dynein beta chain, ciliary [Nymphon striatum]|nr:Dynein beta chain, ciliary [Nymphon striatum]
MIEQGELNRSWSFFIYPDIIMDILSELKDLMRIGIGHKLSQNILHIYKQQNEFQSSVTRINQFVNKYNNILLSLTCDEEILLTDEMDLVNKCLIPALSSLKWSQNDRLYSPCDRPQNLRPHYQLDEQILLSIQTFIIQFQLVKQAHTDMELLPDNHISDFIESSTRSVEDLEVKIQTARTNFDQIRQEICNWKDILTTNNNNSGEKLTLWQLEENVEACKRSNGTKWSCTEDEDEAYHGFTVGSAEKLLATEVKSSATFILVFKSKLTIATDLVLEPPINGEKHSMASIFTNIIDGIFGIADMVTMVMFSKEFSSLLNEEYKGRQFPSLKLELQTRVEEVITKVESLTKSLKMYSFLWNEICDEQNLLIKCQDSNSIIKDFKQQIDSYQELQDEIDHLTDFKEFDGWCQIELTPLKSELCGIIEKRKASLMAEVATHITNTLEEIDNFIKNKTDILISISKYEENYNMTDIMGNLNAIRDRKVSVDVEFASLKDLIPMLRSYGSHIMEEDVSRMEDLPVKWKNLTKLSFSIKQKFSAKQSDEILHIKLKNAQFQKDQVNFRDIFYSSEAFKCSCDDPSKEIEMVEDQLVEKEAEMTSLVEYSKLFDVSVPEFNDIKCCRYDMELLKCLWDFINSAHSKLKNWYELLWVNADVDLIEKECRTFSKSLKSMDNAVKSWNLFINIEEKLSHLVKLVRVIGDLQNQAVKARHWEQVIATMNTTLQLDHGTRIGDLLEINLHHYGDTVRSMVERASKELQIENFLNNLNNIWLEITFDRKLHARTKCTMLTCGQNMVELLEDHQVQLQTTIASRFSDYFHSSLINWKQNLFMADKFVSIWSPVQKSWSDLECIFMTSEDIKIKLPVETENFKQIDLEFRQLLERIAFISNFLDIANVPDILNVLTKLQDKLAVCEKALASYLEVKRTVFPKFFFVSDCDLLDILSNGFHIDHISKHLTKIFGSVSKLKISDPDTNNLTNVNIVGVHSSDGEYLPLKEECKVTGSIENWLNTLLAKMRETVRHFLKKGVASYDEQQRIQWILDLPAQVAFVCFKDCVDC